jgi:CRISPR/Cas system CSM-associated protein Csm2 small subunit
MQIFSRDFWKNLMVIIGYLALGALGILLGIGIFIAIAKFIPQIPFIPRPDFSENQSGSGWFNNEIDAFLYFLTGVGSIALALVAWFQVRKIHKNTEAEFLLKVDERWNSQEILKAKEAIHRFYLEVYKDEQGSRRPMDDIYEILGQKIKEISENPNETTNFIHLLNFLDFMETIGYLCEEKHITHDSLDALCGESLEFNYYKVFKSYICGEREKYGKPLYTAFEHLYDVRG